MSYVADMSVTAPTTPADAAQVAVVVASTRPNRHGPTIGQWVIDELADRTDLDVSLIDLAAVGLPLLDEPEPAQSGVYVHAHTRAWSALVDAADGFVFVTPEHNRAMPASLKNALDCLYGEWAHKPAGFVSYSGSSSGGVRAVEMTRQVVSTLSMLPINEMVNLARIDSLVVDGTLRAPAGATDMLSGLADSLATHFAASRLLRSR